MIIRTATAALAAALLSFFAARAALAYGPPKHARPPVHVCESVDLYSGPVDAQTPSGRLWEACRDLPAPTADRIAAACAAQGPESCEVLLRAAPRALLIERKLSRCAL